MGDDAAQDVPPGLVLSLARQIRDKSQKQLAAAAGKADTEVSDLERGRRRFKPGQLEELFGMMGLSPRSIERIATTVREVRADGIAAGLGVELEEREAIDAIARAWGQEHEDFLRDALRRLAARWEGVEQRRAAPGLWERLRRFRPEVRVRLVEKRREFQSWGLVELLCRESVEAAADSAAEAVTLAELAIHVARHMPGEEGWRRRVEGFAWWHLGNARRVQGDHLPAADAAFETGDRHWHAGTDDAGRLDSIRGLDLKASLRQAQRRFPEALELLDQALAAQPAGVAAARLWVKRGKVLEEQKDYAGAVAALRRAEALCSLEEAPRLVLCIRFNLAEYLFRLGRAAEGAELLPGVRALSAQLGFRLDQVRLRWLEGRIAAALDQVPEAIAALSEVRASFLDRMILYDAALVTLELAALLVRSKRHAEARQLARHLAEIFSGNEVPHEAARALRLFWEAAEAKKELSLDLLDRLRSEFQEISERLPHLETT